MWVKTENNTYKRCSCAELDLLRRCWENFGVRTEDVKKLKDYMAYDNITASAKSKALDYVKEFTEKYIKVDDNWFGLFGQPGAGKSHIVIAIGAALLNRESKRVKAVYMPYLEAMRQLKSNVLDNECYLKLSTRYQKAEILIIDDLFKDKVKKNRLVGELTEADMKHIYPIINYRYFNKLPTIISSECTPKMLLDLDEALAGRILERCDENIIIFSGGKYNYRLRKFEK